MISNAAIGSTHGGILASLNDLTGLYALLAAGIRVSATADMHVDYHRPAIRETVVAQSRPVIWSAAAASASRLLVIGIALAVRG